MLMADIILDVFFFFVCVIVFFDPTRRNNASYHAGSQSLATNMSHSISPGIETLAIRWLSCRMLPKNYQQQQQWLRIVFLLGKKKQQLAAANQPTITTTKNDANPARSQLQAAHRGTANDAPKTGRYTQQNHQNHFNDDWSWSVNRLFLQGITANHHNEQKYQPCRNTEPCVQRLWKYEPGFICWTANVSDMAVGRHPILQLSPWVTKLVN